MKQPNVKKPIQEEKPKMIIIPNDIPKQVRNCFHSYDLCEKYENSTDVDEKDLFQRNKEHIQIMWSWDWFKDGCSDKEAEKLKKYI